MTTFKDNVNIRGTLHVLDKFGREVRGEIDGRYGIFNTYDDDGNRRISMGGDGFFIRDESGDIEMKISSNRISSDNLRIWSGRQLKIQTWDLCLESLDRKSDTTPHRRALVHDFQDGLTVNWARDYPGGVTINGDVKCPDKLIVDGTDVKTVISRMLQEIENLKAQIATMEKTR